MPELPPHGALLIAILAAGVLAVLYDERRGPTALSWVAKPAASLAFVALALAGGAWHSAYGRWVLVALALSLCGDVLLIPRGSGKLFKAGLLSFLSAHLAYVAAFGVRGLEPWATAGALLAVAALGAVVLRWLRPHLSASMRLPVYAYVAVISLMVAAAAGTALPAPGGLILGGAVLFFASDLAVARQRFVSPGLVNRVCGLPLYYTAQIFLALSAAG